ncbi:DUF2887 domain-containing protein [Vulcanococcus sp. Clear-D1]|uniref:DUF2887 domain-containing protein n=1 Tax=Vulcanococcus sp. Clear-D1 TaxID=2766970 RepID=UPI0019836F94|nr:DUF2887 domain-containing protein [Vulcanococcus sp. Clear-D1]
MKTDHWFYGLFQSAPDLITLLLPAVAAASLGADAPGDALYRFDASELKAVNHHLDGVLWARGNENGAPEQPVALLEVQMQSRLGFKHRLAAQSFRFCPAAHAGAPPSAQAWPWPTATSAANVP